MANSLKSADFDVILSSLEFTQKAYSESTDHPDYQFKQDQLEKIDAVIKKVRKIRRERIA